MILENKKKIARELDKPMHAFLYLFGDKNKFDENTQNIFKLLNEWTMGNIWDNFIIVFNKAEFTLGKVTQRFKTMTEFFNDEPEELIWKRFKEQLIHIKDTLTKKARREQWKRMVNVDGVQKRRLMKKVDFANIQISALNFEQARHCTLINGIIDSNAQNCWKLPEMNGDFDYKVWKDNKAGTYLLESPQFSDDEYVFTDEMIKLYDLIMKNAHHPVTTQKEHLRSELTKKVNHYHSRQKRFHSKVIASMNTTDIDVSHCEEKFNQFKNNLKQPSPCPEWNNWNEWSDCPICGNYKTNRTRTCHKANHIVDENQCIEEWPETKMFEETWCHFTSCKFDEWKDISTCSATCGQGSKEQERNCQGLPGDCRGETTRTIACEIQACPIWQTWSDWSQCSKSCGMALQSRSRNCLFNGTESESSKCFESWPDEKIMEERKCDFVSCDFTQWKDNSTCSVTCRTGVKDQTRECSVLSDDCRGDTWQVVRCEMEPCPIWADWSEWSQCSQSCGDGEKSRSRKCINGTCSKNEELDFNKCNLKGCKSIAKITKNIRGSGKIEICCDFFTSQFPPILAIMKFLSTIDQILFIIFVRQKLEKYH